MKKLLFLSTFLFLDIVVGVKDFFFYFYFNLLGILILLLQKYNILEKFLLMSVYGSVYVHLHWDAHGGQKNVLDL